MFKKSPELPASPGPQDGHYVSDERRAGLARLAMHSTFEQVMSEAKSPADGVARMRQLAPHILHIAGLPLEGRDV